MPESRHLLSSPRLRLRPVGARDVEGLHRHWTAPAVRRYLWDDETITRQQVEALVSQSGRLFAEHGYGLWAICQPDSDDLLGCGGFWTFHEPPRLELVLSLSPQHGHRGIATGAARLLIEHAFATLGFSEVLASTDAPNAAALRLLDRLGFRSSHRAVASGLETVFYALPSPESRV